MIVNIDFSNPEILKKYTKQFLPQYQKDCVYIFEDGIHAFGFKADLNKPGKDDFTCSQGFLPMANGVYETFGFGTSNFLEDVFDAKSSLYDVMDSLNITEFSKQIEYLNGHSEFYGVADNWEQVLKVKKEFVKSKDKYILTFFTIEKKNEPSDGGWRWHKWGEYIGNQNPQHEYIYDEENIEKVIVYHFHLLP